MSEITQKQITKFEAAIPAIEYVTDLLETWNTTSPDERLVAEQVELKAAWKAAKAAVRKSGLIINEEGELVSA